MPKKPSFEKISPSFGSSIQVKQHNKNVQNNIAYWHFHPEIELVYVNQGQGKRHIGNHLSYFNNSMLVLIGANLPHNGFVDRLTTTGKETIVQFKLDFLGNTFFNIPEMNSINALFKRARKGILFKPETKKKVGPKIETMTELQGMERVIKLLEILHDLSEANDYTLLNADGFAFLSLISTAYGVAASMVFRGMLALLRPEAFSKQTQSLRRRWVELLVTVVLAAPVFVSMNFYRNFGNILYKF